MNHDQIKDRLLSFEDAELDPREKAVLLEHVENCGECRERLEYWKQTGQALAGLQNPKPSEKFVLNVMERIEGLEERSPVWGWRLPEWIFPAAGYALAAALMVIVIHQPLFAESPAVNVSTESVLLEDVPDQTQWVFSNEVSDASPLMNVVEENL